MNSESYEYWITVNGCTVIGAYEMLGHYLVGRAMELKEKEEE